MKKSLRKGAKVIFKSEKKWNEAFGFEFEVYEKSGKFVHLTSIKEPIFGVVTAAPCAAVEIIS